MLPFDVPAGTTAVRVRYCHDQPEAPTNARIKHVLDLGLWHARPAPGAPWAEPRVPRLGRLQPSRRDACRATDSRARRSTSRIPKLHRQGQHDARLPARADPGRRVGGRAGRRGGRVAGGGRLRRPASRGGSRSTSRSDPLWEADPYVPAPYDETPARAAAPGWYAGDFHVHAEHSSLGDATMTRGVRLRVPARSAQGGAGLDFITLSDYVTDTAWGEIGRYQPDHPGKLIVRSSEVITYRGHANNHASLRYVDHRTGPVYERDVERRRSTLLRAARPASAIFDGVHAGGGFTQINHPRSSPPRCPASTSCAAAAPGTTRPAETDYSRRRRDRDRDRPGGPEGGPAAGPESVHAARDPVLGGRDRRRRAERQPDRRGRLERLAQRRPHAGSGDAVRRSARRPRSSTRTSCPSAASSAACEARHTYVKVFGNDGPDLRFEARPAGLERAARDHGRRRARRWRRVHRPSDRRRPRRGAPRRPTRCSC